ncbi:MAG: amidohydrolase [Thermodesulfobacteriota bacterium]|nr:amidohydrolase [Thermodesulfobacteriota bacterium]
MSQQVKKSVDLILTNGTLLTLSPNSEPIIDGALAIVSGKIAGIGTKAYVENSFVAPRTIDVRGGLIMPGLVNAHNHAAMTCYRGMADDLPLMDWLNRYIFPAESKSDGDQVYWSTLLACAEMIRSGTTIFCDMYLFEDRVAEAAKEAGMRAMVGEVLYDFPSPNYGHPEKGFEYIEALINRWQGDPLISIAIEPHALYTCSPILLGQCRDLAEWYGVPMIIHLAETRSEVEEVYQKYGTSPVKHMENLGLLSPSLIACHCVWLTDAEMDLLARRGVKVVHNPESNMKLASGVAPIPELLARGITVGLGTDGCASNNNLDMFQELDSAAKLHKVHRLDPTVMPADVVLHMATLGGAKVLGLDKEIGSLEIGKKADVIVLDFNRPHLQPIYNIVSHLVYSATGADVRDVIIDGKLVMQDRKLLTLDEEKILQKMQEIKGKILQRVSH